MKNPKHTSVPFDINNVLLPPGYCKHGVECSHCSHARRVAVAAPDMLAVLKAMDEYTHRELGDNAFQSCGKKGADRWEREQLWKAVRDVIAKSTGGDE